MKIESKKNVFIFVLTLLLCISILMNALLAYKYRNNMEEKKATVFQYYTDELECIGTSHGDIDVLILGNSITLHPICNYWWGEWGMAASSKEKDYVHQLESMIVEDYNVSCTIVQFASWEIQAHDRAEGLMLLNPFLDGKDYEYIIIQLGENISDITSIETDFSDLIQYIDDKQSAKILVLGNFWNNKVLDAVKKDTCWSNGAYFVDLSNLQLSKYQIGLGATVLGDSEKTYIIEHEGVAQHPGDEGMKAIAKKIYETMKLSGLDSY